MIPLEYQHRPSPGSSRALAVMAWILIVLIAVALPVLNHLSQRFAPGATGPDVTFQMQGQYTLGAARTFTQQKDQLLEQFIDAAKTPEQTQAAEIVRDVATGQTPRVDPFIENFGQRYPWFDRLTNPSDQPAAIQKADRTFKAILILILGALFVLALGLTLGILAIIFGATGSLRFRTVAPVAPAGIYVEAFALWLVLFVGASVVSSALLENMPLAIKMIPMGLVVVAAALWPIVRGVKFDIYRKDIGLHTGKGVITEIAAGIIGYIACLPLLAIALAAVLLLTQYTQQTTTHPIVEQVAGTNPIWLYLLAAVFAPITEELMFRGLLLSHLRARFGIILSGLMNGLIFAAIHPQGWLAIPTLLIIALNLSLIRQWRDSLIAPMIAHGLNNAVVVTMLVTLMR